MKPLKKFNEYINLGIIRKQKPDEERALSLEKEAERKRKSLIEFLNKIGLKEENANDVIENCYNILMFLIRANLFKKGYSASGLNAHEAEISYLFELNIPEEEIKFMNELRYFRNGILYYGKELNEEYANKVISFLNKMHKKFKEKLK